MNSDLAKKLSKKNLDGTFLPLFYARDNEDIGIGDIASLYKAVDLHAKLGLSIIELLPLNPSSAFESPYSVLSSKLYNTIYISINKLAEKINPPELLIYMSEKTAEIEDLKNRDTVNYERVRKLKNDILGEIYNNFQANEYNALKKSLRSFKTKNKDWLVDHILFVILREKYSAEGINNAWDFRSWPEKVKNRNTEELKILKKELKSEIDYQIFLQWIFHTQWQELLKYASDKNVFLMGDMPYSVDGADIWINPEIFGLNNYDKKRLASQGVPPDMYSDFGQYWQFFAYDFNNEKTEEFLLNRLQFNMDLFSIVRLDHVLGYYRSYMFFEDSSSKATLESTGLWDKIYNLIIEGHINPFRQGDIAWEVYKILLDYIKENRELFFGLNNEEIKYFSSQHPYMLEEGNMLLMARKADYGNPRHERVRQFCVEKVVFENESHWDFLKISKDFGFQDHEKLCSWLFAHGDDSPKPWDSIRPCYFVPGPGEDLMKKFLDMAKQKKKLVVSEALGVVPEFVVKSMEKIKAMNYVPLIFGMTPAFKENPYFTPNHIENSFVTFALHDSDTVALWWEALPLEEKQNILDYFYKKDKQEALEHENLNDELHFRILAEVYKSKGRIKMLLWPDILKSKEEGLINKPGNQTGQWVARMPVDLDLDMLLMAAEGKTDDEKAVKTVNLLEKLHKKLR